MYFFKRTNADFDHNYAKMDGEVLMNYESILHQM